MLVREGQALVEVNLEDYLDTGLFLDHRPIRREINKLASGKSFLNLFCYTSVVTVQAAIGGAKRTLSVDMSNTYLDWSERNFRQNHLDLARHRLLREDCLKFLHLQSLAPEEKFDLIFWIRRHFPTLNEWKRFWIFSVIMYVLSSSRCACWKRAGY